MLGDFFFFQIVTRCEKFIILIKIGDKVSW